MGRFDWFFFQKKQVQNTILTHILTHIFEPAARLSTLNSTFRKTPAIINENMVNASLPNEKNPQQLLRPGGQTLLRGRSASTSSTTVSNDNHKTTSLSNSSSQHSETNSIASGSETCTEGGSCEDDSASSNSSSTGSSYARTFSNVIILCIWQTLINIYKKKFSSSYHFESVSKKYKSLPGFKCVVIPPVI